MSTWREKLQPASFRGVPFSVQSADTEEGRRGVLHEYPLRNEPYVEDMGRRASTYAIEAIILGNDYFQARDALRAALIEPGAGELIHPTLGRLNVSVTGGISFSEQITDAGGICRFSLRFTETEGNAQPSVTPDTARLASAAAATAQQTITDDFVKDFTVEKLSSWGFQNTLDSINRAVSTIQAAIAGLMPDMSGVAGFVGAADNISSALAALVTTPLTLANRLSGLTTSLSGAVQRPMDALDAVRRLFGYRANQPSATTPHQVQVATNVAATETLVRRSAMIEAVRLIARIDFTDTDPRCSYDRAVDLRDTIADALENEAADASFPIYSTFADCRVAFVRDITARAIDLPRLTTIRMPATLPALVVAHRSTGDARRADEIVALNNVRHPGFVPGGVDLRVLT